MADIKVFQNNEFGEIRTVTVNNEPWFVGKDIATVLGYSNSRDVLVKHFDDEDKAFMMLDIAHSQNGNVPVGQSKTTIINESRLYSLILSGKLPKAKKFKRRVTAEVLPSIRRTGGYVSDADIFINAYLANADEQTKMLFKTQLKAMQSLNNKIETDKSKVLFADSVSASSTSILISEPAKLIKQNGVDIGSKRLFKWMRNNGYLINRKGSEYNMPTQKSMNLKLFEVKETAITHSNGHTSVNKTPKLTGKGQIYFINKFLNSGV